MEFLIRMSECYLVKVSSVVWKSSQQKNEKTLVCLEIDTE